MRTFGAQLTGNNLTLPRERLISQLKAWQDTQAYRDEEGRRARVELALQRARRQAIRVTVPAATLGVRVS